MRRNLRTFSGTTNARRQEARVRLDIADALDCGVAPDVVVNLKVRGKRHGNMLPNAFGVDEYGVNRGHGEKKYGVRPEKRKDYSRRSIRENPLTDEDFYEEPEV